MISTLFAEAFRGTNLPRYFTGGEFQLEESAGTFLRFLLPKGASFPYTTRIGLALNRYERYSKESAPFNGHIHS